MFICDDRRGHDQPGYQIFRGSSAARYTTRLSQPTPVVQFQAASQATGLGIVQQVVHEIVGTGTDPIPC